MATVHHASDLLDHTSEEKEKKEDIILTREQSNNAPPQSIVIMGAELGMLTEEQEDVLFAYQEVIFKPMTPEKELRIVRSIQSHGGPAHLHRQ